MPGVPDEEPRPGTIDRVSGQDDSWRGGAHGKAGPWIAADGVAGHDRVERVVPDRHGRAAGADLITLEDRPGAPFNEDARLAIAPRGAVFDLRASAQVGAPARSKGPPRHRAAAQ